MSENKIVELAKEQALVLDCGKSLKSIKTAYTTYGKLNAAKDNAILICHALTGDQYVASNHPITKKEGWWSYIVGPCLLYTSDAADDMFRVYLGGRRIIKKSFFKQKTAYEMT